MYMRSKFETSLAGWYVMKGLRPALSVLVAAAHEFFAAFDMKREVVCE
jgi:hypothetical protein